MHRRYNRDTSSLILSFGSDKSERFVLRKCINYLIKHLEKYKPFDQEGLQMLCWVLGSEMNAIGNFLIDQFNDAMIKGQFLEDFSEAGLDPDENSEVIIRLLNKSKPRTVRRLESLIFRLLKQRYTDLRYSGKSNIEKSFSSIKRMFNLTRQETEFCIFLFIVSSYDEPESFFTGHLRADKFQGRKYITNILGVTWKELDRMLQKLKKIGVVEVDSQNFEYESDFLCMLQNPSSSGFSKHLYNRVTHESVPLGYHFIPECVMNHLLNLLRSKPKTSTNILLYGPPGTGKTTLANGIAKEIGLPAYEISRDENNSSINRRAALIACMNMTGAGKGSIIIVDEADNLLNTKNSWLSRGETQDKGWLNKILEEPGSRIIWITNHIYEIEDSVLRRFAFSLDFKPFGGRQRIQLWDRVLRQNKVKRFFKQTEIENLAKKFKTSAGAIDLAVKKAIEMETGSKKDFLKSIALSLDANQTLQNRGRKRPDKDKIEDKYTLDGLNIDGDINFILQQVKKFDQYLRKADGKGKINMNLLLYGPPGAGKSEFARFVADELDRELICKSYADIQSPYVGLGEQNIKAAFEEAEAEEAILVIDEVDSFLFSRDRAKRSWEMSFTNEFLTQMERFKGILICTTNRFEGLDEASIRRFNHKIEFGYLSAEGNVIFYRKLLEPLLTKPLKEANQNTLRKISNLTPGDFKLVRDRYSFYPLKELSHQEMIHSLKEETMLKQAHRGDKPIGF